MRLAVVQADGICGVDEYFPAAAFQNLDYVVAFDPIDRNIVERVVFPVPADSVHCAYPQASGPVRMKTLYLVVRQSGIVVAAAEILVVFVGVVSVESPEGAEPDMPLAVLGNGCNPVVGQGGRSNPLGGSLRESKNAG